MNTQDIESEKVVYDKTFLKDLERLQIEIPKIFLYKRIEEEEEIDDE